MLSLNGSNYVNVLVGNEICRLDLDLYHKFDDMEHQMICEYVDTRSQYEAMVILSKAAEEEIFNKGFQFLDEVSNKFYLAIQFQMNKMGLEEDKISAMIEEYKYFLKNKKRMPK